MGKVQMWNLKTGERLRILSVESTRAGSCLLRGVALTEDGSSVIAALDDGSLQRWDLATGKKCSIAQPKLRKVLRDGEEVPMEVERAIFSRDGRTAAFMGQGCIQVIDVASGDLRFKDSSVDQACAFSPTGGSLAIVRAKRSEVFHAGNWKGSSRLASTVAWLDSQTGDVRRQIEIPASYVRCLAFSPDGQTLAVSTSLAHAGRGIIRIFRLRNKREIQTIETPGPWIEALTFTPDGRRIIAGLADTSIVLWDVPPG